MDNPNLKSAPSPFPVNYEHKMGFSYGHDLTLMACINGISIYWRGSR